MFIGMFDRGLYGSELAKKNRYCPTNIYGCGINANCKSNKYLIMNNPQDIGGAFSFKYLLLKDPNYSIIMMSTYYVLVVCEFQKKEYRTQKVKV